MVTKHIQANYDCLQEMLKAFMRHADMTVALTVQVEGLIDQLRGGAWRGVGAEAFYAEMGDLILPAMRKLEDALQFTGEGTGKIHTILREAEEEAARLFRGEGESGFTLANYQIQPTPKSPPQQGGEADPEEVPPEGWWPLRSRDQRGRARDFQYRLSFFAAEYFTGDLDTFPDGSSRLAPNGEGTQFILDIFGGTLGASGYNLQTEFEAFIQDQNTRYRENTGGDRWHPDAALGNAAVLGAFFNESGDGTILSVTTGDLQAGDVIFLSDPANSANTQQITNALLVVGFVGTEPIVAVRVEGSDQVTYERLSDVVERQEPSAQPQNDTFQVGRLYESIVGDDQIDNKDIAQGPYIPGGVRP